MKTLADIRSTFLRFFEERGHARIPSAPLVPQDDPTLLFVNAGMVPFKRFFTAEQRPPAPRAATAQKCVRAGGKHNDLDNVGYTARHHTFFEMLGNFSFGDYFKEEAIHFGWDLVTKDFGLPAERLLVTVYVDDDEAFDLWRKISGLPEERILRIAGSDNFWAMGDTGPCGPCSEIFYDHGPDVPGGPPGSADEDGDRFVEIWNLVFMQYEAMADGTRRELPKPCIDTGMGLERIAAVLQGVHSNYETDLFRTLLRAAENITGNADPGQEASRRVIADHVRSGSFLIADGVLPANEGRGYVLRRILRRAMRHAHLLGTEEPVLHRLAPTLIAKMKDAYPELERGEATILDTLKGEEDRFQAMLGRGLGLLEAEAGGLRAGDTLPGEIAFKLYDTFGFPLDLTEDALRARGIGVDHAGFEAAMQAQRDRARAAWSGSGGAADAGLWLTEFDRHGPTVFTGYDRTAGPARILSLAADGQSIDRADKGQSVTILLDRTPFYGESGGQVGDTGFLETGEGARVRVDDTTKAAGGQLHIHHGVVERGTLETGAMVEAHVDTARRDAIRANHSATHLLHAALRAHLGTHVTQQGSLVAPDRLRFDISHNTPVDAADLTRTEAQVNAEIRANTPVTSAVMGYDEAVAAGAMALFGEKYGDEVRVIAMGQPGPDGQAHSMELCGGTHVARTGDIGVFAITREAGVAAGVRRVEALTGSLALEHWRRRAELGEAAADSLRVPLEDLPDRVASLAEERRRLERELAEAKKKLALSGGAAAAGADQTAQTIHGVPVLARTLEGVPGKELRPLVDEAKAKLGSGVVAFVSQSDGKAALAVGVTEDLTETVSAVDLVKAGAAAVGGKGGGGRADFAQAGGPDGSKAGQAVEAIKAAVASHQGGEG